MSMMSMMSSMSAAGMSMTSIISTETLTVPITAMPNTSNPTELPMDGNMMMIMMNLSRPALIGIIVGVVAFILILAGLCVFCILRRRRRRRRSKKGPSMLANSGGAVYGPTSVSRSANPFSDDNAAREIDMSDAPQVPRPDTGYGNGELAAAVMAASRPGSVASQRSHRAAGAMPPGALDSNPFDDDEYYPDPGSPGAWSMRSDGLDFDDGVDPRNLSGPLGAGALGAAGAGVYAEERRQRGMSVRSGKSARSAKSARSTRSRGAASNLSKSSSQRSVKLAPEATHYLEESDDEDLPPNLGKLNRWLSQNRARERIVDDRLTERSRSSS